MRYLVIGGKRVRDDQIELEFDSTGHRNADIRLSDDQLLGNLHTVQDGHGIKRSSDVDTRLDRRDEFASRRPIDVISAKLFDKIKPNSAIKSGQIPC